MPVEIQSAPVRDVVEQNLMAKEFAEVFLPHPENLPLEQVLTLQPANQGEQGSYQSVVIDTQTHEAWVLILDGEDDLIIYPWGTPWLV